AMTSTRALSSSSRQNSAVAGDRVGAAMAPASPGRRPVSTRGHPSAWCTGRKWVLHPMAGPGRAVEGGRVNNDALVAALGRDAATAVASYRELVVDGPRVVVELDA